LEDAFDYYERQRRGLGSEFLDEYVRAVHNIAQTPERWPVDQSVPGESDVHRFRLARFPYAIVYQIRLGYALIVA
jgi:hypothetical protein